MSSQASSASRDEATVRRKLIETGDVDVMIAIRSNFFYTRAVPCELWFFNRAKPAEHRNQVLMIDARNIYRKVTRKIYDFSPEQEQNLLAIEAVKDRRNRQGKLGVFWHTQGAGKSYSMVMFTRKVHRRLGGNFTFVILTDREGLDSQIYKTFAGCGLVDHDRDPCRAADGEHLEQLLAQHKTFVFSLIQKFNRDVNPDLGLYPAGRHHRHH